MEATIIVPADPAVTFVAFVLWSSAVVVWIVGVYGAMGCRDGAAIRTSGRRWKRELGDEVKIQGGREIEGERRIEGLCDIHHEKSVGCRAERMV